MANKVEISAVLKRTLKEGKEYDKLIPRVKCERTNLGEGDTFDTVDWMKGWIEKYAYQTAKLSTTLKGRSLEETVNNIYRFLYDHVQYTADGELQQLRSPACTWAQRKEGVDCKSYSVFASCILSNLGIKHFIRQVRQPYFYPEEFTHVYVVVPKDQNVYNYSENAPTLVLDATKHQNSESSYIEKVDLQMTKLKHIGLNAPQDERTQKIVRNFEEFCQFLIKKGISVSTVNAIRERVNVFTSNGKDPMVDIVHDGLVIQGILFPLNFTQNVPFITVRNAFYGGLKSTGLSSFTNLFAHTGAPKFGLSSDVTGGIVDGGLTLASGALPFGGIIKGILDKMNISANISNVLKYGFSSWGASATPEEMKKRFAELCYPWLQEALASITMDNIDRKLNEIDTYLRANHLYFIKLRDHHSDAKSTRLANDWAQAECEKLLNEAISGISQKLQAEGVSVVRTKARSISDLPGSTVPYFFKKTTISHGDGWTYQDMYVYKVDKTTLKSWNNAQMTISTGGNTSQPTTGGNYPDSTGGSNYQPTTGTTTGSVANQGEQKSNTGLIIGGVALASIPLLFMMKKPATSKRGSK